jgi:hypothetical protein
VRCFPEQLLGFRPRRVKGHIFAGSFGKSPKALSGWFRSPALIGLHSLTLLRPLPGTSNARVSAFHAAAHKVIV